MDIILESIVAKFGVCVLSEGVPVCFLEVNESLISGMGFLDV